MAYYTRTLKNIVKEKYKLYDFGRGDTKLIIDLAKIFKVELDESRLEDYKITDLEYWNCKIATPSIAIYDLKNKIQITSRITSVPSIGNVFPGNDDEYFEIRISSEKGILTKAYYTCYAWKEEDKPIVEQLEFNLGDNSIVFTREDYKRTYSNPGYDRGLIIFYCEKDRHGELFFNRYLDYEDGCYHYFVEQKACRNKYDRPDNYIYCDDSSLIYAIQSDFNSINCTANGIFIENCNDGWYLRKVFSINIEYKNFSNIKLLNAESFMVYLPHDKEKKEQTRFEIYKTNEKIIINCKYLLRDNNEGWITTQEENIELPIMNIGPITGEEVRSVTNVLQSKCDGNIRKILCDDFLTYADMLDDRSKSLTEYDMLSSKKLFNTSFEDILEEIGNNKEEYFALADKQFREMAQGDWYKAPARVLKQ